MWCKVCLTLLYLVSEIALDYHLVLQISDCSMFELVYVLKPQHCFCGTYLLNFWLWGYFFEYLEWHQNTIISSVNFVYYVESSLAHAIFSFGEHYELDTFKISIFHFTASKFLSCSSSSPTYKFSSWSMSCITSCHAVPDIVGALTYILPWSGSTFCIHCIFCHVQGTAREASFAAVLAIVFSFVCSWNTMDLFQHIAFNYIKVTGPFISLRALPLYFYPVCS